MNFKINFNVSEVVYYLIQEHETLKIREAIVVKPPNDLNPDDTSVELIIDRIDNKFIYATYDYMLIHMFETLDDLINSKFNKLDKKTKEFYTYFLKNDKINE